jgi:hypothetical protein
MPGPTIQLALPYEPDEDLTAAVYTTVEHAFGPDVEVVLDVEQDQGAGDILPYVGVVLTYVGMKGLDVAIEQGWKSFAELLLRLARGDRQTDQPAREVRLTDRDRQAVFVFDTTALADPRAASAMVELAVPDTDQEITFAWDAVARTWHRVDP